MPGRLLPCASWCASKYVASGPSGVLIAFALGVEIGLDQPRRLSLAAGHQVPVGVESDGDRGVMESAIVSGAEGNTYRGHDGFRAWAAESEEAFEELRSTPKETRDLGDRVLMLGHVVARGRESGAVVESQIGFLWTLRGRRMVHAKGFLDWAEALEAAGLSE